MLSLAGAPTKNLVPPGVCQLNGEFQSLKLIERVDISPTSTVLRFSLPDEKIPLNLSTCACILAKADLPANDGGTEPVIRPYTPISTNALVGSFDLLVKVSIFFQISFIFFFFNFHSIETIKTIT